MIHILLGKFSGLDPHQRNMDGDSPRMIAYRDAYYDGLSLNIRRMFETTDSRIKGYEGTLMLSHAIWRNSFKLVKFLIHVGADPRSTDDAGRSQIELAALWGDYELFQFLYHTQYIPKHQLKRSYHACMQRGRLDSLCHSTYP